MWKQFCDFICWTPHGMHIERINHNLSVFATILPSLTAFFKAAILPSLLKGKEASMQGTNDENFNPNGEEVFCNCRKGEFGDAVACAIQIAGLNGFILVVWV